MTSKADRLRAWAPGADPALIAELAGRPAADVDAVVRFLKEARLETIRREDAKRRARRDNRRRVDEAERTAAGLRIIDATGKRAASNPEALAGLAALVRAIDMVTTLAVDGLRERGYSDRDIADALGVTPQAVSKRWKRSADLPAEPGCWAWPVPPPGEVVTLDDLRAWQFGRCALCGLLAELETDHDHDTGLVRGFLCASCNVLDGKPGRRPEVVRLYRDRPPAAITGARIPYARVQTGVVTPLAGGDAPA